MKKFLNLSLIYAIAAMAGGVFYREFTKFNGFTGVTALGKVHTHLFLLGMLVFLVIALYGARFDLREQELPGLYVDLQHRRSPDGSDAAGPRGDAGAGREPVLSCRRLHLRRRGHRPCSDRRGDHFAAAVPQKAGKGWRMSTREKAPFFM